MLPHANQSRPQVQCYSTLNIKETLNPIVSTRMYVAEESRSSFQCCNVFPRLSQMLYHKWPYAAHRAEVRSANSHHVI